MKKSHIAFMDIDTQYDFLNPEGSLYVPNGTDILPHLKQLINLALEHRIPLVASADAHPADDPEFKLFPPHCVKGESGQLKIDETRIESARTIEVAKQVPLDLGAVNAVVMEKTIFDIFGNENTEEVLTQIGADEYILFGVATEYCVKAAALGLRKRGYRVQLVTDAIKPVTPEGGEQALQEMKEAGVAFTTTENVLGAVFSMVH